MGAVQRYVAGAPAYVNTLDQIQPGQIYYIQVGSDCVVGGGGLAAAAAGASIGTGSLLLGSSVLLLLQGLVRDLWLISRRNRDVHAGAGREALCMCVESTIGVTGVVTGLAVLGSALDATLALGPEAMGAIAVVVLAIGFAIKDLVFELRPFRIRRDKDHLNIVFRWKP